MPAARYTYSRSPDQPYALEMLPLREQEHRALLAEARSTHRRLFAAMAAAQEGADSVVVASMSGVSAEAASKATLACSTTTAFGSLEEVAALYVSRDSSVLLDFNESKALYALEGPSKHAPMRYAGVRWSRWKSPSKLVSHRDVLYVEFMDAFTEPESGRRGWARCTRSVVHACCPESQHPYGPVRAELLCSGMILRETDTPGVLEVSTLVHLDTHGVPSFLAQKMVANFKASAHNVSHVLKLVRLMNGGGAGQVGSVGPDGAGQSNGDEGSADDHHADDRACRSCSAHVSKWTRARRCRHCDEVLCKTCATVSYTGVTGSKPTRMCVDCAKARAGDSSSSSSWGSDSLVSSFKHRNGSNRSIDTDVSLDSLRGESDAVADQMNDLQLRKSMSSSASSSSSSSKVETMESHSLRQQMYLLYQPPPPTAPTTTTTQQRPPTQQPSLQWINRPRGRGSSMLSELTAPTTASTPAPAVMDLSYLNDLVGAKAK
ncbi:hypothetical protein PybrP1_000668 [[Pythium] brassicae (nom. inval.)]|nr:hypothetical protein PybrP1_000668 [[Pythium] brassicae (nom. inval.)]